MIPPFTPPGHVPPGYPAAPAAAPGPTMPMAMSLPAYNIPDEAAVASAYSDAKKEQDSWGGKGPQYVKFPPPPGFQNWKAGVPVGFESFLVVYVLPPWAPSRNIFRKATTHFGKSMAHPMGMPIVCPGPEVCLVCRSKEAALSSTDPNMVQRAKQFGRVQKKFLYNVVLLENYPGHFGQDGVMHPFVLAAGTYLHTALGDIIQGRGGAKKIVDPREGRPLRLKKRKSGPTEMDVEYSALDLDPMPLPPHFFPALQNLWDLDKINVPPTGEEMAKWLMEMGLPVPSMTTAVAMGGFGPAPSMMPPGAPAYPSPYPAAGVGLPAAPTYMPPPADPYEFPPRGAFTGFTPSAPAVPPPVTSGIPLQATTPPPSPYGLPPGLYGLPPGLPPPTPPPVAASPAPASAMPPAGYIPPAPPLTPPVSGNQALAQPQAMVPQAAPAQVGLSYPLLLGTQLPGGREKCFGRYNPQNPNDRYCLECPPEVKGWCIRAESVGAGGLPPLAAQGETLEQLQARLRGR